MVHKAENIPYVVLYKKKFCQPLLLRHVQTPACLERWYHLLPQHTYAISHTVTHIAPYTFLALSLPAFV